MILHLGCIVEGYGEVDAVPLLVRRIHREVNPDLDLQISRPWRLKRQQLIKAGELEIGVEKVARTLAPPRAILILLDSDDDCPAKLAPEVFARARNARPDISIGVVLAKHEFEAWFLAAIESIEGKCGVARRISDLSEQPENIRGAKQCLRRLMESDRRYGERVDQPKLTAIFDMRLARSRSDSFDKCWRVIEQLLGEAAIHPVENRPPTGSR